VVSEDFPGGAGGLLAGLGPGSRVGGYRLEEQAGAGGMAVVFRAVDERLGRRVALKVLAPGFAADAGFRQRFLRESRAAAAVDDPHIIPVHEAGEAGGVLFIAMRFVPGGDVRSLLHQHGPLPPARAAAIISPVASALDAAHAAGLVHRDVKPANMLVDVHPHRPDHVYLSDFGLSKGTLSSAGLTGTGQYLGTPDYMAPEQIEGGVVDGRADQYALACAAFELLCGEAPFRRDQGMAVLFAHLQQPPPSLSARRPGLPAAADGVFARALAKDPADRYPTCRQFADALREALGVAAYYSAPGASPAAGGQPPAGHPATEIGGPPGPGSEEAAVPAGAAAASTMGPAPGRVTARARAASSASAPTAGPGHPGAESGGGAAPAWRRHWIVLAALGGACILAAAAVLSVVLTSSPGHASSPGHTGLVTTGHLTATLADPGGRQVDAVAFSRDGRTLAAGDGDGSTYLWDVATGHPTATLADPGSSAVYAVAFSPDGRTLAAGDGNGSTYLWDVATRQLTATLPGPGSSGVAAVAFSPDGRTLAAGDYDGSTYLWDVATGYLIATLADPGGSAVYAVAFSPDGRTLAAGDYDGTTYLWDVATRHLTATLPGPSSSGVATVAFSPDGRTLAAGDYDGSTYLSDVATRVLTATLADPGDSGVAAVAFSPDGRTLAAGASAGSTYLWDVAAEQLTATLTDPSGAGVAAVAFSPDGRTLATGASNGSTYLWEVG
jgi:Tol biopolymer transport system component